MQGCLCHRSSRMLYPVDSASIRFNRLQLLVPFNDFIDRKESTIP